MISKQINDAVKAGLLMSFYLLGAIGVIDFTVQQITDGEIKVIHIILDFLFS